MDFISCKKNIKHNWESECVARLPTLPGLTILEESEGGLYGRKFTCIWIAGSYCNNQGYVCGVLEENLLGLARPELHVILFNCAWMFLHSPCAPPHEEENALLYWIGHTHRILCVVCVVHERLDLHMA